MTPTEKLLVETLKETREFVGELHKVGIVGGSKHFWANWNALLHKIDATIKHVREFEK